MIKITVGLLAFVLASAAAGAAQNRAGTYQIDPAHTYAHFQIDHMGLSTMRGRVDASGGTIVIADNGRDSKVQVTLDPASVDTGNRARDKHLRDMKGFFDVKQYSRIKFVSTHVRFDDDDEATVKGRLTLHGVTHPVTLDVDHIACRINPIDKKNYTCGFNAETELSRSDYGMDAYASLVGDKVELSIEAEADRPADAD